MENQAIPKGTIEEEFASASLGDARLTKRLMTMATELAKQPDASFPQVFDDTGLAGTYRFMSNPKVTPEAILEPHKVQTAERAAEYKEVIVAHDTTEYGFGTNPREGLGYVGRGKTYGFKSHVSLVVAPGDMRTPLGLIALQTVNRTKKKRKRKKRSKKGSAKKRGHKALQRAKDNEGRRWLQGIEEATRRLDGKTSAIHVTDREGDSYGLIAELCKGGDRFVIRAAYDRRVHKIRDAEVQDGDKLRSVLARTPALDTREIAVSRRDASPMPSYRKNFPPREGRSAVVSIKAICVTIKRPASASECEEKELTLNLVQVIEENPPEGQPPVEWLLWTTEPIESAEDVWKIVDFYRARWLVEEFFKAMKTGCAFEKRQLESAEALFRAQAVFIPIAWRLLLLRTLCRYDETTPAEKALEPVQLLSLREALKNTKFQLPDQPTVRDALLGIAKLGGHLEKNGEPGWLILARGFERLILIERGFLLAMDLAARSPEAAVAGRAGTWPGDVWN